MEGIEGNFSAFPEGGSSENSFGKFYHNCGVGMCIIGFIAGIIFAIELDSFWVFLGVCLADFLASIGYFAISRIFKMLQQIMTQNYVCVIELLDNAPKTLEPMKEQPTKSASAEYTTVSADMVTNAFTQVEQTENKDAYHFKEFHFPKRFTEDFECPNCGNVIPSFMNVCNQCNTRFYFDN